MAWYYRDGDQEIGPVSKEDMQALAKAKRISGQTLVRSTAMTEWKPLAETVRSKSQHKTSVPPPVQASPDVQGAAEPAGAEIGPPSVMAVCSQCGRSFPQDRVVTFDDNVICAACKPIFVQKIKEGATLSGSLRYAGFWIRFGAKIIDWLILAAVSFAILIPVNILALSFIQPVPQDAVFTKGTILLIVLQQLIGIVLPAIYTTFFIGRFGATLGKMACRLEVVTPEGGKVSYLRAFGRNFAEWLSGIVLLVGYLMVAFDGEKRALHDRVSSTRVVYKR